jgi:hypothetical protein
MNGTRPVAFVIMPFAPESLAGFRDVIRPAVERAGLECVCADQEPLGHIHRHMFERIFDSPTVIAHRGRWRAWRGSHDLEGMEFLPRLGVPELERLVPRPGSKPGSGPRHTAALELRLEKGANRLVLPLESVVKLLPEQPRLATQDVHLAGQGPAERGEHQAWIP